MPYLNLVADHRSFIPSDVTIYITPEQLADNLGLTISDIESSEEEYEKKYLKYDLKGNSSENLNPSLDTYKGKYLKYKQKYLALKKLL
jgi:hypothetical protein